MSKITKDEPEIGDTKGLYVYLNCEDEENTMLEFVQGEDEVLVQIPVTQEQVDLFVKTCIDVV